MEYVELNNGVKMPILGFGVYQIPKEDTKRCVLYAIKVGFRSIDIAQSYFNESEVYSLDEQSQMFPYEGRMKFNTFQVRGETCFNRNVWIRYG